MGTLIISCIKFKQGCTLKRKQTAKPKNLVKFMDTLVMCYIKIKMFYLSGWMLLGSQI